MDRKVSKYFCIFCENCTNFSTINEAYNHYKQHMNVVYYCLNCDNNRKCDENHSSQQKTSVGSEPEEGLIEMWIERFLSYQNEIIEKTYSDLFRTSKLFTGCAVCETFLRLCTNDGIPFSSKSIVWSTNQSMANETRHVCSHLRYYPFECYKCEKVGRYHKKCDLSEISRHIKSCHSLSLKDTNFEGLVKCVKIRKLENFIEYNFKNRNQNQQTSGSNTTTKTVAPKPVSSAPAVNPIITRNAKRAIDESTKPVVNSPIIISESKPKRTKIESKIIVNNSNNNKNMNSNDSKNTTICSEKTNVILNIKKPKISNNGTNINEKKVISGNNERTVENSMSITTAKVEIKFKPIVKTYGNPVVNNIISKPKQNNLISCDQIIIKKVPEVSSKGISIINKTAPNMIAKAVNPPTKCLSLSQQFSDMMDDEDGDVLQMDSTTAHIISKPIVDYFCVFCSEKFVAKESAHQHIQKHLDYYPIACLTCGEGLTDLTAFMKHHRESHPEAVKGRYKKKEQSTVDKWISTFLYSQTTIVRSFPPRESCPVCDRVFSRPEVMGNKPRRCTINRKIDHLYRHMSYLPYECILCQQSGQEFFVAYFESKAHSHIKLKHPQIDDNESRWHVFQKTISIPKLDEFIENYLTQFGISMQYERRPVKKSIKYCSPIDGFNSQTNNSLELSNTSLNLNMIFSDIIDSSNSPKMGSEVLNNNCNKINDKQEIDLISIDDNMESVVLNEYNSNSNDSNIVVDVSPLTLFDKSVSENSEEELYFCIFCPQMQYFSKIEAYSHYGSHLEYLPVLCKICSNNFSDVEHLMTHHQSLHPTLDCDYEICEDQILVKWVNEFLESQLLIKKVMSCSCSYNCPVCIKLFGNELPNSLMPCDQHNDVLFSVHIHKHLNYFPYECITCKRNGKSVRVPNLDSMAMTHLKEHKIENASMSQVVKNFPKTLVIPQLEKLIGDSVHRKRVSEKKNRLDFNPFIGSQQTISNNNSLQINNSLSILSSEPSTSNTSPNKTQHIRLEGGRVVNLPPKTANADNSKTPNNSNGTESETNRSNVTQNNNICCINCRKYFPNKQSFKLHHNQSHPGKPILCSKNI